MAEPVSVGVDDRADGADGALRPRGRDLVLRTAAAGGCAALVAGLFSAVVSRLAMSLLASLNPEDAGVRSDDDFVIGQVTLGGTVQLTAATVQLCFLGGGLYLLLRPFLVGTGIVRVVTSAIGFGVTFAAVIIHPDGVDFTRLEPLWLGIVLFVAIPVVVVACYSALAEYWLRDGSWFMTAPRARVNVSLAVWILAGVGLIVLLPTFLIALVVASGSLSHDVWQDDDRVESRAGPPGVKRLGQAALVTIAGVGTVALIGDISGILA